MKTLKRLISAFSVSYYLTRGVYLRSLYIILSILLSMPILFATTLENNESMIYQSCVGAEKKNMVDLNLSAIYEDNLDEEEPQKMEALLASFQHNNRTMAQEDEIDPFNGLYISANYSQYVAEDYLYRKNVDYEYKVKLRWELFKDGYFESKKKLEKESTKIKLSALQATSQISEQHLQERLYDANKLRGEIRLRYFSYKEAAYTKLLKRRKLQLEEGYITQDDYNHIATLREDMQIMKVLYEKQERMKIDPKVLALLNHIEYLQLVDKDFLYDSALEKNIDLKIQSTMAKQANYDVEYVDNLKLYAYAQHQKVDQIGWFDTVGVYADIPIDFDGYDSQSKRLQNSNIVLQERAVKIRLKSKLDSLYDQFALQSAMLKISKNGLGHLFERKEQLKAIIESEVSGFKADPEREYALLKIKIIDQKYEVMMKRMDLYVLLLKLYRVANVDNIAALIQKGEDHG